MSFSQGVDIILFVRLARDCIQREQPHCFTSLPVAGGKALHPRDLNPAFYGCFDWHSAVHSHWALVRALRFNPDAAWAPDVRAALAANLTETNLAAEAEFFAPAGRESFERPYGLAWLLQLAGELREWDDRDARQWLMWLKPLELICVRRLSEWLPRLPYPIRTGEHNQTAFAMALALDWARTSSEGAFENLLTVRARDFHASDRAAPLHLEPSAFDFLSPSLAAADLLRRVMDRTEFAAWLDEYLPQIPRDGSAGWLAPVRSADPADGKLSHLDGLNLSRAWMLDMIAEALPPDDLRRAALQGAAQLHARAGLAAISPAHYTGAHWLGSFAVHFLTRRGLGAAQGRRGGASASPTTT